MVVLISKSLKAAGFFDANVALDAEIIGIMGKNGAGLAGFVDKSDPHWGKLWAFLERWLRPWYVASSCVTRPVGTGGRDPLGKGSTDTFSGSAAKAD
ncbi:MAG: hypothetical protein ABSB33_03240 [Tepidisphaeraceae bacterium]|jgi:hypothetical protein